MKPELRVEDSGFERGIQRAVTVAKNVWFFVAAIAGVMLCGFSLYGRLVDVEKHNAVQDVEIIQVKADASEIKRALNEMKQEFREYRSESRESFAWIKDDLRKRP